MSGFKARLRADVRRTILQLLAGDLGYSHNHEVLRSAIDHAEAVTLTETEVQAHLAWLDDAGLITTETKGRFVLATITPLGLKVAEGSEVVEGVSRPRPEDL